MGDGRFTLRQVDTFMRTNLSCVYRALNRRDPYVGRVRGGVNEWGGSENIGGSPRATGSGLKGTDVLEMISRVMGPREHWWKRMSRMMRASRTVGAMPALPSGAKG